MSRQDHRLAGCEGKRTHPSWAQAVKESNNVKRHQGIRVVPYNCRFCGGVHLGTPNARDKS